MTSFTKSTSFARPAASATGRDRTVRCRSGLYRPVRLYARSALALAASFALAAGAQALEANDQLSVNAIIAGAGQCLNLENGGGDDCEGAVVIQPEISLKPTKRDEIFAKAGFAEGNGLNTVSPFALSPWAVDLEADLENINGRSRDHLLTAWYKHTFEMREDNSLSLTAGLIDSTDYLDDNAYSNDEFTQFMNVALVNGPNAVLPSYDWGGALQWDMGPWSIRGVVMNVGKNDDGNNYNFYAAQLGRKIETRLGEGNYRVLVAATNNQFLDPAGASKEALSALLFSIDQELGENVGLFVRVGWQDDDAAITHEALYSGGLEIKGGIWGREKDTVGLAYAHLDGGNVALARTEVYEAYYRHGIGEKFALTADIQYVSDRLKVGMGPKGTIVSLRGTAEF